MSLIELFPGVKRNHIEDSNRICIKPPVPTFQPIPKGGCIRRKKTKRKY